MKRKSDQSHRNAKEGQEPATKADVAAVKSELKADVAAVKTDLAVVKTDLAVVKSDLAAVKADVAAVRSDMAVMKSVLEVKIEDSIKDAKEELIEHMDQRIGEFVNHVDAVFVEIKTGREEQAALAQHSQDHDDRIDNHDKRITKLEVKVGGRAG